MTTRKISLVILTSMFFLALAVAAHPALAETALIVPLGTGPNQLTTADVGPANYILGFYRWSIGFAALLAMAQLVFGGLQYIFAAGSVGSQETANERMRSAITGLVILLAIVIILVTINPQLLDINPVDSNAPKP